MLGFSSFESRNFKWANDASLAGSSTSEIVNEVRNKLNIPGLKEIDITDWNLGPAPQYGQIVTLETFTTEIRPKLIQEGKTIVATSGGYDPLQPGHSSNVIDSKQFGDVVVLIVNGDWFLENKKNPKGDVGFESLRQRCQIASHIRFVDYVVPFEIEGDSTVSKALEVIHPHIFTKGGDRTGNDNTPESQLCNQLGIEIAYGVGSRKVDSSSWITQEYFEKRIKLLSQTREGRAYVINLLNKQTPES